LALDLIVPAIIRLTYSAATPRI